MENYVICFDLDDTLYKEIDYLKSAYKEIATSIGHPEATGQMLDWYYAGENAFKKLIDTYGLSVKIADLLKIYREHYPDIRLEEGFQELLEELKEQGAKLGLISDGRSLTQWNKIKALGLDRWFDNEDIIISEEFGTEKPNERNYLYFEERYPNCHYSYVGDNADKDFIAPNKLGWDTYGIRDRLGLNIHNGALDDAEAGRKPLHIVDSAEELKELILK